MSSRGRRRNSRRRRTKTAGQVAKSNAQLRDGGDLVLFPDGFPTTLEAEALWVEVRRQELAAAMLREAGDDPLFRVRRVPIRGDTYHTHRSDRQHVEDSFTRGIAKLGPLGFSLLRGQIWVAEHLALRLNLLRDAYDDLIAGAMGAREEGLENPDWLFREKAPLIFWDAVGILHQISEQTAGLFLARQRWLDQGGDLGEYLLSADPQAWKVIGAPSFRSPATWRKLLGLPPSRDGLDAMSPEDASIFRQLQRASASLFLADVRLLVQAWSFDVHRGATRYKHSFPVLSVSHGVVWLGDDSATRREVRELVRADALVVADASVDGDPIELVFPVTIGAIELLFQAVLSAIRVSNGLTQAILQSVEHLTGRQFVLHPTVAAQTEHDVVVRLLATYLGERPTDEEISGLIQKAESRRRINEAAHRIRAKRPLGGSLMK